MGEEITAAGLRGGERGLEHTYLGWALLAADETGCDVSATGSASLPHDARVRSGEAAPDFPSWAS